jgi:hypothetical protein
MQLVNYVAITISDTMFISTTETVQLFFVTATAEAALIDEVMSYDNVARIQIASSTPLSVIE